MPPPSAPKTGLVLKVHTSNYRIEGFTAEVRRARTRRARARARRSADGRSRLRHAGRSFAPTASPRSRPWRKPSPTARDLVTFSGDKLLGGPQAGFIVGPQGADRAHQPQSDEARAARGQDAARGDRSDAAALPRSGAAGRAAADAALAGAPARRHRAQADALAPAVAALLGRRFRVRGRRPARARSARARCRIETIPSAGSRSGRRRRAAPGARSTALAAAFRQLPVPVIGRIADGALDLRSALSRGRSRLRRATSKRLHDVGAGMIVGTAGPHRPRQDRAGARADRRRHRPAARKRRRAASRSSSASPICRRPTAAMLGFVDVPGHERFVRNMLAGATGIDFALLVVAADDGVMPQTREHLAIVDLLGVARGARRAHQGRPRVARAAARPSARSRARCRRPALAAAEIVPVSARDRRRPRRSARRAVAAARAFAARRGRPFRLAVDRSFTLRAPAPSSPARCCP